MVYVVYLVRIADSNGNTKKLNGSDRRHLE